MRVLIYGSRPNGHARVVVELLAELGDFDVVGLIDDHEENADRRIGGVGVVGRVGDLGRLATEGVEGVVLGFGATVGRLDVIAAVRAAGLGLPLVHHPTASIAASSSIGDGAQVLARAIVASGARVGAGVLIGHGAIVEHDARLADGVVIGPGAVLAGRVSVEREAELGAGAVVLPDRRIGARARVGAGAVVTRDVADDAVVVGVPARER